jgi:hypothetical protein
MNMSKNKEKKKLAMLDKSPETKLNAPPVNLEIKIFMSLHALRHFKILHMLRHIQKEQLPMSQLGRYGEIERVSHG